MCHYNTEREVLTFLHELEAIIAATSDCAHAAAQGSADASAA